MSLEQAVRELDAAQRACAEHFAAHGNVMSPERMEILRRYTAARKRWEALVR